MNCFAWNEMDLSLLGEGYKEEFKYIVHMKRLPSFTPTPFCGLRNIISALFGSSFMSEHSG